MITSKCRSCGSDIVWVVTPAGKNMPLDAMSTSMWLIQEEGAQQGSPRARLVQVRTPHWASCPHAAEWRKPA